MTKARIRIEDEDENFTARTTTVQIGSKRIETPKRVLHLRPYGLSEATPIRDASLRGLNEVYRLLSQDSLRRMNTQISEQERFQRENLKAIERGQAQNELTLFFLSFEAPRLPTPEETQYLFDLCHSQPSDAVALPLLPRVSATEYLAFVREFFIFLETVNEKPIVAVVPHASRLELSPLITEYLEREVRLFCMDLNNRHPFLLSPNVLMLLRELRKRETETGEPFLLYALNTSPGRASPRSNVTPARDILALTLGFDCFGKSHIRPKLTPDLFRKFQAEPSVKLFDRRDYGFHRVPVLELASDSGLDPQASIDAGDLRSVVDTRRLTELEKAYNAERQALEAKTIRTHIEERDLQIHIERKRQVRNEVNKALRFRKELQQRVL